MGPISHHYQHIPQLATLATFSFIISILSFVFKIILIVCIVSNPNSERYSVYEESQIVSRDDENSSIKNEELSHSADVPNVQAVEIEECANFGIDNSDASEVR